MTDEQRSVANEAPRSDKLGLDLQQLVDLYRDAINAKDETFASRIAAEALTSESTAMVSQAAEAISSIASEAVAKLASLSDTNR